MKRKFLDLLVTLAFALAGAATEALAQDDGPDIEEHPFEVGAQLTFIGVNFPQRVVTSPPVTGVSTVLPRDHVGTAGFGGRVSYNAYKYVALEAEVSHLPERNLNETFRSRRTQIFAGVRAGRRWEKVGLFAKGRPGAMFFDNYGIRGPCGVIRSASECLEQSRAFFATDVGGVFEYYPTRRTILRVDAGDTIIRFRDSGPVTFPPAGASPGSSLFTRRETTHNFQLTFGLGFRF
jgi:hypothetical protein